MSIAPPIASNRGQQRPQPDVTVGDELTHHDSGVETRSVVGDRQHDAVAALRQPDLDCMALCVPLMSVSCPTARYGSDRATPACRHSSRARPRMVRSVRVSELPQQVSNRRREAELCENLRM